MANVASIKAGIDSAVTNKVAANSITPAILGASMKTIADGLPTLVWAGLMSQQGTNAPTVARVLYSVLSGPIIWSYSDPGLYLGTLAGAFPDFTNDPAAAVTTGNSKYLQNAGFIDVKWSQLDTVAISTSDTSLSAVNNLLSDTVIEIYIYP